MAARRRAGGRGVVLAVAAVLGAAGGAAGCGPAPRGAGGGAAPTRYEGDGLVLSSAEHGPELCLGAILDSDPPQCRGIPVTNWDWAAVEGDEPGGSVAWMAAHVVGTYDGRSFTMTEPPGPARPRPAPPDEFEPGCAHPRGRADAAGTDQLDMGALQAVVLATWASDPEGPWDGPFTITVVVKPGHGAEAERHVRRSYRGLLCVVERDGPTAAELDAIQDQMGAENGHWHGVLGAVDTRHGVVQATLVVVTDALRAEARRRWGGKVVLDAALRPVDR